jgi:hypothetical protein
MRRDLPLSDGDFARIRESVLAAIETRRARRTRIVRVTQISLLLLLVIVVAMRLPSRDEAIAPVKRATLHRPPAVAVAVAVSQPAPQPRPARRHHTPKNDAPIRIELTTEDPDVRIIWIASSNESSTGETP